MSYEILSSWLQSTRNILLVNFVTFFSHSHWTGDVIVVVSVFFSPRQQLPYANFFEHITILSRLDSLIEEQRIIYAGSDAVSNTNHMKNNKLVNIRYM